MEQTYSPRLPNCLSRPLAALGLLLAATGAVQAQTPAATFTLQATPSTGAGSSPASVAIADVNGDGNPDALTGNYRSNTLSVLLGNGAGGFTLQANAPSTGANSSPYSVAIADVNSDGNLDALTANIGTRTLSVLLGNGAGGFTLQPNSPSPGANNPPYSVAIADVNGDGKPDALTTNFNTGTLGVLLGNGTGGFTLQANAPLIGAGSYPQTVDIADVNGDGKLDALVANEGSSTLSVLLGNGAGGFTLQANAPSTGANSGPQGMAIADVNGDGKPDALTANAGSSTLGVLLNTTVYAPTLTSVGPNPAAVGTSLTLTGTNLTGATAVLFTSSGGVATAAPAGYVVASSTSLTGVVVPTGLAPGLYTLTVTTPSGTSNGLSQTVTAPAGPLPVALTRFVAAAEGVGAVRLAWATASEKNSHSFEVERSTDGVRFAAIGTVAAAGTTATAHAYALRDAALPAGAAVLYYRLRQVDLDGTAHYSPVRSVAVASGLSLYPNPAPGGAATLSGVAPGAMVQVLDGLGRAVATATADGTGTAHVAAGLAPGVYVVRAGSAALRLTVQ